MKKTKQQVSGHDTNRGFFSYLVVRWYSEKNELCFHLFYSKDEDYERWNNNLNSVIIGGNMVQIILKDINYLLNEMVKQKGTTVGFDLFKIYKDNYKNKEHIKKVQDFLGISE